MEIRPANIEDAEALVKLMYDVDYYKNLEKAKDRVERYIINRNEKKLILVLEDADKDGLVGYVGIKKEEEDDTNARKVLNLEDYALLTWVGVHSSYRLRGLGSRLVGSVDAVAKSWNKKGIWLDCRIGKVRFYIAQGYSMVDSYLGKTEAYYIMAKRFS